MPTYPLKKNLGGFDPSKFILFVFQPNANFYDMPFETRLKVLERKILASETYLKNNIRNTEVKGLFVAPEYLFKDFSKKGPERYYTHAQKKIYQQRLKTLSEKCELVIAPGTINWCKPSKADGHTYYRNSVYFFHHGNMQRYKKIHPWRLSDYDYVAKGQTLEKRWFRSGIRDESIKEINDLKIGIEICLDHDNHTLLDRVMLANKKIDIHLVIADGTLDKHMVKQAGILYIKVERLPYTFSNTIGTINHSFRVDQTQRSISLEPDLDCYDFKKPGLSR